MRMNNVDCVGCHQLGQEATRTLPSQFGTFETGEEGWMRRLAAGQSGESMTNRIAGQMGGVPYKYFGDWTDRVAKGELPKNKPARPRGLERNLVVTTWDWSTPDKYLHDLISSDRRKPTVNAGRQALRLAGIFHRHDADPRSEDAHCDLFQDAGCG